MAKRKKKVKRGKDWYKKLDKQVIEDLLGGLIENPVQQLDDFFDLDFKALVQECNGLKKAADRKAFIEPFKPLLEAVRKACKMNPRAYVNPNTSPKHQLKSHVYSTTQVVYGWLKHGHKYKKGELNEGTTLEKLQALQDKCSNGKILYPSLVESYLIYDGMSDFNLRVWATMSFAPINYIITTNSEYLNKEQEEKGFIPFGADGGGNAWGIYSSEGKNFLAAVYDKNHESPDDLQYIGTAFCDLIYNNHQLERHNPLVY